MRSPDFRRPRHRGILLPSARAADPPKLELKDGDRIVYLGNTFVERDAELRLLRDPTDDPPPRHRLHLPQPRLERRHRLGRRRAGFGTRADGFKHLKDHVLRSSRR